MSLILNIPADYIGSDFIANTPDEIAIMPKLSSPKLFLELRKFPKYLPRQYAFHYLHDLSRRVFRRSFGKYVHMVFHYFHDIYMKALFLCYMLEDFFQISRYLSVKNLPPILGYPNQMVFQIVDRVLRPSYSHATFYNSCGLALARPCLSPHGEPLSSRPQAGGMKVGFLYKQQSQIPSYFLLSLTL